MPFHSILFKDPTDRSRVEAAAEPGFFHDLNLDQVVAEVTAPFREYDLTAFFHAGLRDADAVRYRQEVMRCLERADLGSAVHAFSANMREVRRRLKAVEDAHYPLFADRWFLEAVAAYCGAVKALASELEGADPDSRGLRDLLGYLEGYIRSDVFTSLAAEARRLLDELAAVRYCVLIDGNNVTVRLFRDEDDYTTAVERIFERFRRQPAEDYLSSFAEYVGVNHVTAEILEGMARLQPELFGATAAFRERHASFLDETLARFDREIQFYVAYLAYVERLRRAGLPFCYPLVSRTSRSSESRGSFDMALAAALHSRKAAAATDGDGTGGVVANDFFLDGFERVFVVSGPNQGGKTTFARAFGQMHHLASLGCAVPGTRARLFLCDRLFTHFERREHVGNLRGKLQDDLVRMHSILEDATSDSVIIMNEMFTSTTVEDALTLGTNIMERLTTLGALGVWVTFLTELASYDEHTVSMVAGVDPSDPTVRTYRIERRPADGLAYAMAIAEKHKVTYEHIVERIRA